MLKKIPTAVLISLLSCLSLSCSEEKRQSQTANSSLEERKDIGVLNAKHGDKAITFTPDTIEGNNITVHGEYNPKLFGEVILANGTHALLLDERGQESYSGAGLLVPTVGVIREDSIYLESQAVRYTEMIQKALLKANILSEITNYSRTESPTSDILVSTLQLDLSKHPESSSYIRNLVLVELNKKQEPRALGFYRDNLTDKITLSLTFWKKADSPKQDTYIWISSYPTKQNDRVSLEYGDVINGNALNFISNERPLQY